MRQADIQVRVTTVIVEPPPIHIEAAQLRFNADISDVTVVLIVPNSRSYFCLRPSLQIKATVFIEPSEEIHILLRKVQMELLQILIKAAAA